MKHIVDIVPASLEDLDTVQHLYNASLDYHYALDPLYYHSSASIQDRIYKYLHDGIASRAILVFIARRVSGESLGLVTIEVSKADYFDTAIETYGSILELFLLPESRGLGLGQKLIKVAEEELKKRGCRYVHLQASSSNHSTLAFYQKSGFLETQRHFFKALF